MQFLPHLLAFLLFPAGRIRRRWFALGLFASIVAFIALAVAWARIPMPFPAVSEVARLAPFLAIWVKTALTSRRLHDVGLTGWLSAPGALIIVMPLSIRFVLPALNIAYSGSPDPRTNPTVLAFIIVMIVVALGDLILCFIPGTITANRFGPAPGRPTAPADLF